MTLFDKGLITVAVCAILFVVLAIPLILRKVPPNLAYGYRTRATLTDPALWYDANAHFGRGFLVATVLSTCVVYILYRTAPLSPQRFLVATVIALVAPPLLAALATARYVSRRFRS